MEKKKTTKKPLMKNKKSVVLDLDFAPNQDFAPVSEADVVAVADPVPNPVADNTVPNPAPNTVAESKLCKQEKNHSKNLNILDTASLEFLTNPLYHKIKRGVLTVGGVSMEDLNFYRKRIVGLTKELTKLEPSPTKDVQAAFDTYVFSLVRFFKLQDTQEIVQTQVVGEEVHVTQANNDSKADRDSGGAYHTAFDLNTLDTELMTLPPHANTLDNYILKTSPETTRVIPIKIDFDTQLHAPEFKIKGIKKKLAQEK